MSAEEQHRQEREGEPEEETGACELATGVGGGLAPGASGGEPHGSAEVLLDEEGGADVGPGLAAGTATAPVCESEDFRQEPGESAILPVAAGGRLKSILEAVIFCSETPLSVERMVALVDGADRREIKRAVEELVQEYRDRPGGLEIVEVAGGFQVRTRPEFAAWVAKLRQQKPARLSRAALEVVAIVAYRQPVTRAEIEAIRGVDCAAAIGSLLEKKLIRIVGRKEVPGRPILYGTTQEFLELFGLKNLKSLPTLREIEGMFQEAKPEERQPELEVVSEPSEAASAGKGERQPSQRAEEAVEAAVGERGQITSRPPEEAEESPFWESEEEAAGEEKEEHGGRDERESLDDVALRQAMDDVLRKTKVRFVRYEDVFKTSEESDGQAEEGSESGAPKPEDSESP